MKSKKIILIFIFISILLAFKNNYLMEIKSLSNSIVLFYNYFDSDFLIDITTIVIYSIPLSMWLFIISIVAKSYYDNYCFLVTRVGGKVGFLVKFLIKVTKETFMVVSLSYVITIVILSVMYKYNTMGNMKDILLSFMSNYSMTMVFVLIFCILMIFHSFSVSLSITYIGQIALLVISLFFEYIGKRGIVLKNSMMMSIVFSDTLQINSTNHLSAISMNVVLIICLLIMYILFFCKKEI